MCLRECYALSDTDFAHGATGLCACYAVSGSDTAYVPAHAMRCPGLMQRMSLWQVGGDPPAAEAEER
eukprot:1076059-Rhodomonas_salina.5